MGRAVLVAILAVLLCGLAVAACIGTGYTGSLPTQARIQATSEMIGIPPGARLLAEHRYFEQLYLSPLVAPAPPGVSEMIGSDQGPSSTFAWYRGALDPAVWEINWPLSGSNLVYFEGVVPQNGHRDRYTLVVFRVLHPVDERPDFPDFSGQTQYAYLYRVDLTYLGTVQ